MFGMDFKPKGITWVGNIYQKFEAVCQEVDDIVSQDAVKYVGNQVQNVGDSVKKFYSDVIHELLPPTVNSVKHEDQSLALKNNDDDSSFKSVASVTEIRNGAEENPSNNAIKSLYESNANDPAHNQQAHASIGHELVSQVSDDETSSIYIEMEDSCSPQKDDCLRGTSNVLKENLHVNIEQSAIRHTLSFSGSSSGFHDNGCDTLPETEEGLDVKVEQKSCVIVKESIMKLSTPKVLDFRSLGEKETFEASILSQSSDGIESTCGILVEVSPATSVKNDKSQAFSKKAGAIDDNFADKNHCVSDGSECSDIVASSAVAISTLSCENFMVKVEPSSSKGSLVSDSHSSKSSGSYFSAIESSKSNSIDHSSMSHFSCAPTSDVAGHIMASKVELVSSDKNQSMESNGESTVDSIKSSMEEIQLNDERKLEESCVFVDERELYAVSRRAQRLRSYKKRIRDAFSAKKRLTKEYEQLAIWYGDAGMDSPPSQNVLPFGSGTSLDGKNLQAQHACDSEWELL
ncbi:hypothetical protein L6164_018375 [Bauhinia variegata]|uniref:Uncharacterized protein n=1 Tax=Bauhinia variegata TaxID=167791 RepID=A0ACB9ND23_BAUVA|nr:hypothetical protein L6164_018375 [Bauhinia variegata]